MQSLDGVFRREWGAAVAAIARWSGDLTVAEDAVQEACTDALRTWPRDGMPANPGAWLMTTAKNRALNQKERQKRFARREDAIKSELDAKQETMAEEIEDAADDDVRVGVGKGELLLRLDHRGAGVLCEHQRGVEVGLGELLGRAFVRSQGEVARPPEPARTAPPALRPIPLELGESLRDIGDPELRAVLESLARNLTQPEGSDA